MINRRTLRIGPDQSANLRHAIARLPPWSRRRTKRALRRQYRAHVSALRGWCAPDKLRRRIEYHRQRTSWNYARPHPCT